MSDDAKQLDENRAAARLVASQVLLGVLESLADKLRLEEDSETLIKAIPQLHRVMEPPKDEAKANLPVLNITIHGGAIAAEPVKVEVPLVEEVPLEEQHLLLPEPGPTSTETDDFLRLIGNIGDV